MSKKVCFLEFCIGDNVKINGITDDAVIREIRMTMCGNEYLCEYKSFETVIHLWRHPIELKDNFRDSLFDNLPDIDDHISEEIRNKRK